MDTALGLAVIAGLIGVPLTIAWWRRRASRIALEAIAVAVDGRWIDHETVTCTRYGQALVLRRYRDGGKHLSVTTSVPRHYPLQLELRRETFGDLRAKKREELIDIRVGDRAFDEMFVVEGTPAEVVARVIAKPLRELLLANSDARVVLADNHELVLTLDRWPEHATAVAAIEAIAIVAAEVPVAFAAAGHDSAADPAQGGAPYRGTLEEHLTEDVGARNLELFELRERKRRRDRRLGVTGVIGLGFGVAMLVRYVLLFAHR